MKPFATREIEISLETFSEANCRYSYTNSLPYDNPDGSFDRATNGTYHSQTITVPNANATYVLRTGCSFDNGHLAQGSFGDLIIFSVDNIPPSTVLIDKSTNGEYVPDGIYVNQREFRIECDDSDARLGIGDEPIHFGEREPLYCIGDLPRSCVLEHADQEIQISAADDIVENDYYIFYTCVDNGDNIAPIRSAPLLVRDTTFLPPDIGICDPLNPDTCWQ